MLAVLICGGRDVVTEVQINILFEGHNQDVYRFGFSTLEEI